MPSSHDRAALIDQIRHMMQSLSAQVDPDTLKKARRSARNILEKEALRSALEPETIKIDRARNVAFVKEFLNSPAGAHLKDRLLS